MLAAGALAGLCIAGNGLFDASGGGANALPPGTVARVNQGQILLTDLRTQTETLFDIPFDKATPAQRQEVLDSMITEELLVQRALETGIPATDAATREALVAAVQLQSTTDVAAATPTEAQLRAHYEAHPERYAPGGVQQDYAAVHAQVLGDVKRDAAASAQRDYAAYLRQKSTVIVNARLLALVRKN